MLNLNNMGVGSNYNVLGTLNHNVASVVMGGNEPLSINLNGAITTLTPFIVNSANGGRVFLGYLGDQYAAIVKQVDHQGNAILEVIPRNDFNNLVTSKQIPVPIPIQGNMTIQQQNPGLGVNNLGGIGTNTAGNLGLGGMTGVNTSTQVNTSNLGLNTIADDDEIVDEYKAINTQQNRNVRQDVTTVIEPDELEVTEGIEFECLSADPKLLSELKIDFKIPPYTKGDETYKLKIDKKTMTGFWFIEKN